MRVLLLSIIGLLFVITLSPPFQATSLAALVLFVTLGVMLVAIGKNRRHRSPWLNHCLLL